MRENRGKILGTILFVLLISCILYLIFFSTKKQDKGAIKMISITGNNLLSENDYLLFTKLNEVDKYNELTLPVIKDRFEKHPYIDRADVEFNGLNKVNIVIKEKKITAIVLSDSDPYFVSEGFQILPFLSNTKLVDLPVISNLKEVEKMKVLSQFDNDDMMEAFKIIEAAKLTNINIMKRLAEINMKSGGDIILTFSGFRAPIIFGRGEIVKKMVYLEIIWDSMIESEISNDTDYIDLRFANEVFVGNSKRTGIIE
jgi:cell division septal protein FtsQ